MVLTTPGGLQIILTVNNLEFQDLVNLSLTCSKIHKNIFRNQILLVSLIKRGIIVNLDKKKIFGKKSVTLSSTQHFSKKIKPISFYNHIFSQSIPINISFKFTKKYKNCEELMIQFYERLFTQVKRLCYRHKNEILKKYHNLRHIYIRNKSNLESYKKRLCKFNPNYSTCVSYLKCFKCNNEFVKIKKEWELVIPSIKNPSVCKYNQEKREFLKEKLENLMNELREYDSKRKDCKINGYFWYNMFKKLHTYYDDKIKKKSTKVAVKKKTKYKKLLDESRNIYLWNYLLKNPNLLSISQRNSLEYCKDWYNPDLRKDIAGDLFRKHDLIFKGYFRYKNAQQEKVKYDNLEDYKDLLNIKESSLLYRVLKERDAQEITHYSSHYD